MEILDASPFRYVDLFGSGRGMMAAGFSAWAGVFSPDDENWHALGSVSAERKVHHLAIGERVQAFAAADDFMRNNETEKGARKSKGWLGEPATEKQAALLARFGYAMSRDLLGQSSFTKYGASCHTAFQFNRTAIEQALGVA